MQKVTVLAALGMLGVVGAANAEVSATVTATNDYVFRGISQASEDPALQLGLDFNHSSGWYIGVWGSNVDFGPGDPADIEVDIYTGFAGETAAGLGWDVGINYYTYPDESDYNFPEIYAKLSYGVFSGGLYYSNDWAGSDEDSLYIQAGVSVPFGEGFTFDVGAGYSFGDAFDDAEYFDYSIGVGYTVGNFNLSLAWVDTDIGRSNPLFSDEDALNTEGRVVFTISTTFPWAK